MDTSGQWAIYSEGAIALATEFIIFLIWRATRLKCEDKSSTIMRAHLGTKWEHLSVGGGRRRLDDLSPLASV